MHSPDHNIESLFLQIGLDNTNDAIEAFIHSHRPLAHDVLLHEADFWNRSQAEFLRQSVADDADWAIVVDQLDALLR